MNQFDAFAVEKRSPTALIIIVVVILGVVGAGGYLAWSKRGMGTGPNSEEIAQWCTIRQEWSRKVDPLAGDIMLKSVKPEDKAEFEQLVVKRNQFCDQYAKRLQELKVADPTLQAIEVVLIKEGKTRANLSVEIGNALAQLDAVEDTPTLIKMRDQLKNTIVAKIREGKRAADQELNEAMTGIKGQCTQVFRGPITDQGTADNPYVTWDELEMKRSVAQAQVDEKIKKLEPREEFANRVYHELIRLYRPTLSGCYKRVKERNRSLSDKMGLRVRLKPNGEVKTLAIEWMDNQDERLLDCFLEKASKWRLPRPESSVDFVVVTVDFASL